MDGISHVELNARLTDAAVVVDGCVGGEGGEREERNEDREVERGRDEGEEGMKSKREG